MVNRQDFRPKLFDEDDPVFVGTLSVFMAMAAVLLIYVWNTEPARDGDAGRGPRPLRRDHSATAR